MSSNLNRHSIQNSRISMQQYQHKHHRSSSQSLNRVKAVLNQSNNQSLNNPLPHQTKFTSGSFFQKLLEPTQNPKSLRLLSQQLNQKHNRVYRGSNHLNLSNSRKITHYLTKSVSPRSNRSRNPAIQLPLWNLLLTNPSHHPPPPTYDKR
jgi:hypothetical protein